MRNPFRRSTGSPINRHAQPTTNPAHSVRNNIHTDADTQPQPLAENLPSTASRGLGDSIEKIATKTGLKKIADAYTNITGRDCGCAKRRDALNKTFPYH